jgi:iron(III) transport system permease protein
VHGLFGASLVMTLGLYPLVYLPVAAALRRVDSSLYEVARSLGLGRFRALLGAVLPQIRAALPGGCLMVLLGLLAEYGAFEILRFQTFTTEIFTEFNLGINPAAASALSLVLVVLSLLVIGTEMMLTRSVAMRAGRPADGVRRYRLGWGAVPSLLFMAVLVGLGVPASWLTQPSDLVGVAPIRCSARPGTRCCTASWPRCWRPSRRSPSRTWRRATPGGCPACSNGSGISCRACRDW